MRKNKLGHKATKRCWIADLALVSNIEHSVCSGGRTVSEAEAKTPNTWGNIAFVQLGKFDRWLAGAVTTTSTETLSPPPTIHILTSWAYHGICSSSSELQDGHDKAQRTIQLPSKAMDANNDRQDHEQQPRRASCYLRFAGSKLGCNQASRHPPKPTRFLWM